MGAHVRAYALALKPGSNLARAVHWKMRLDPFALAAGSLGHRRSGRRGAGVCCMGLMRQPFVRMAQDPP